MNNAPLSFIYKKFRNKDIKINDHWVKENYILQENDVLKIYVTNEQLEEFNKPKKIENLSGTIDVIYEDENILIVNKPKGILVHGDEDETRITLTNKVQSYLYKKGEFKNDGIDFPPSPVHRLDRNTAGLVIYAKDVESAQILLDLLKEKEDIKKNYIALVKGEIKNEIVIDKPLIKNSKTKEVRVGSIKDGAKEAISIVHPIEFKNGYSLINVELVTGRTHQIRVHLASINCPIIGDGKYGDFEENKIFEKKYKLDSQFLYANSLFFNKMPAKLNYLSKKEFKIELDRNAKNILLNLNFSKTNISKL